jgi:dienelactone hydrolase
VFFGAQDIHMPYERMQTVAAHHPGTVIYPEAGHGFMRDGSEDFCASAAEDAWSKMTAHFERHLRPHG